MKRSAVTRSTPDAISKRRESRAQSHPRRGHRAQSHPRRGGILIVAMVCLLLVTLILGSLLKMTSLHHRQMRAEQQRLQADWLAESGLERAAAKLAADQNYSGETWEIAAADLGSGMAGAVTIVVAPHAGNATERKVSVEAVYPSDTSRVAKRSKQAILRVNAKP